MKALLIDDEPRSRSTLKRILEKYCKEVTVVGQAANVDEGYASIQALKPDVVFLDIEMPNGTGFDLLQRFEQIDFEVIFTTGFNQYAIQAIKFGALDYVLKPLDVEEVMAAVKKIKKAPQADQFQAQFAAMMSQLKTPKANSNEKVALPTAYGLVFVAVNQIIRLEAEDNYTRIHILDQRAVLCTRTLRDFDEMLKAHPFIRCHRKHLINKNHLKKYYKGEGGYVEMVDGSSVDVSRRRKEAFLREIGG